MHDHVFSFASILWICIMYILFILDVIEINKIIKFIFFISSREIELNDGCRNGGHVLSVLFQSEKCVVMRMETKLNCCISCHHQPPEGGCAVRG